MNPNLEMQISKTQAGVYTVTFGRKEAPLHVQEAAFAANGLSMISPAQLGFLRVKEDESTFNPYSRTNADVFYDDRGALQIVIVPDGAISKQIGIANLVGAHNQNKDYVIPENQRGLVYAMVDEMLRKGIAFIAPHGTTEVDTSRFGEIELTSRLFSDEELGAKAQDHGDWLGSQGRKFQEFSFDSKDYAKSQKGPYLNRLRVFGLGCDFYVNGDYRILDNINGAFGVRFEKTAEGSAKKE